MRGWIYWITCKDKHIKDDYIGSTNNLHRRLMEHKRLSRFKNRKIYNCIRENGGWDNWDINIIDIDIY